MKVSISVMASLERERYFPYLKEVLGDVPFSIDGRRGTPDNIGIWENSKRAWKMYNPEAQYHLVIQDDAILCKDFYKELYKLIKTVEKNEKEPVGFQLFVGDRKNFNLSPEKNGYVTDSMMKWGVAMMLPVNLIDEMIEYGDKNQGLKGDDTKVKYFLMSKGIKTVFPIPCLVDHRSMNETPTLTGTYHAVDRVSSVFIGTEDRKIPKIIHQIWIGDETKMPKELMDTWKMEGWEYMLWTEKEIDSLVMENRKLYDYFYNKKCYYGASDVVRLEVIKKYGGIYIDADTERLLRIDDLLSDYDFFSVESNTPGRIANGVIASIPKHPIIENYIKEMGNAQVVEPVWRTIGGTLFTKMINLYKTSKTKIHKPGTFYPFDSKGNQTIYPTRTYARHYWGSTHKTYGTYKFK